MGKTLYPLRFWSCPCRARSESLRPSSVCLWPGPVWVGEGVVLVGAPLCRGLGVVAPHTTRQLPSSLPTCSRWAPLSRRQTVQASDGHALPRQCPQPSPYCSGFCVRRRTPSAEMSCSRPWQACPSPGGFRAVLGWEGPGASLPQVRMPRCLWASARPSE